MIMMVVLLLFIMDGDRDRDTRTGFVSTGLFDPAFPTIVRFRFLSFVSFLALSL